MPESYTEPPVKKVATIYWTYEDVLSLQPDMPKEQAEKELSKIDNTLYDAMLNAGWAVVHHEIGSIYDTHPKSELTTDELKLKLVHQDKSALIVWRTNNALRNR